MTIELTTNSPPLGKFLWNVKLRMTEKGGSKYELHHYHFNRHHCHIVFICIILNAIIIITFVIAIPLPTPFS